MNKYKYLATVSVKLYPVKRFYVTASSSHQAKREVKKYIDIIVEKRS